VFRRACSDASVAFAQAEGDSRVTAVGALYETVLGFLHCHHRAEDELLFPLLAKRCPDEAGLLARMEAQHGGVTSALGRAEALLAQWRTSPGRRGRAELVSAIGELGSELGKHIDEEEAHILPLAADHVALEEWGAMPRQAMASFQSVRKWLIQGLVREQMTESQLAHMTNNMPPAFIEAWKSTGAPTYARFMTNVRAAP
jgi:hypothetical protein